MNYKEFKTTYKWMIKNYPDTTTFFNENDYLIGNCTVENYEKHGSKWILTDSKDESMTNIYYCNVVDSIPFFRNLGGREIVTKNYTKYGYIPTQINSISPEKTRKTIRKFKFN